MSRLAGVVPVCWAGLLNQLASSVGAANRRIGEVSQNIYYPGRLVNKQMGGNYAIKSAGGPTGMAMGGFDDMPFLGGVLDLNRIRYTVTNPGVYLSKQWSVRHGKSLAEKKTATRNYWANQKKNQDVHGLWRINNQSKTVRTSQSSSQAQVQGVPLGVRQRLASPRVQEARRRLPQGLTWRE